MEKREPISCALLKEESEATQREKGDCLPEDYVSTIPDLVHLDLKQNHVPELSSFWKQWSHERRELFREKYGDLMLLPTIRVDTELVRAMVQFWDPSYRCFVFNEVDMVPTVEEYSIMLRLDSFKSDNIFRRNKKTGYRKKLATIMKVEVKEVDNWVRQKGKQDYISWDFLRDHIGRHLDEDWSMGMMAVAIYGMVVFPKVLGYIDVSVIDFVEELNFESNVTPAILSETFRSLNYCRRKGEGRFVGCLPLLYMWMKSHLECQVSAFHPAYFKTCIPIKEFCESQWPKPMSKKEWVSKLRRMTRREVVWRAPWMRHAPILVRCGNFPWVPLLGLWGAISYAPAMVRRQSGSEQFIPMTHGLAQFEFDYNEVGAWKRAKEATKAWKLSVRANPGVYTNNLTPHYLVWHARRGKDVKISLGGGEPPKPVIRESPIELELAKRKLQEEKEELERENKRLRKEMKVMSEQRDQENQKAVQEREQSQKMIDELKGKVATANLELIRVKEEKEHLEVDVEEKELEKQELQQNLQAGIDLIQAQVENVVRAYQEMEKDVFLWKEECAKWKLARDTQLLERIFEQINNAARVAEDVQQIITELRDATPPVGYYGKRLLKFLDMVYEHYGLLGRLLWRL